MRSKLFFGAVFVSLGGAAIPLGCGDDPPPYGYPPAEQVGQPCSSPANCYPEIDPATLEGDVICMDRVSGGYCTHTCDSDADCCAVPGECKGGYPQVCSPLESAPEKYCFLSCEGPVLRDAGWQGDDTAYCNTYAHTAFNCRSSGGGSENRKVCLP